VFDGAEKFSEKHRMYFVVVPEGYGDQEPVVQLDTSLNASRVDTDTITISGSVLSGAEDGQNDVYIEAAFMEASFDASAIEKYNMKTDMTWAKVEQGLGDSDTFSLTLSLDGMYTNKSESQRVFIKIYEGEEPNERWTTIKWIEIQLPACQGLEADPEAEAAGGEFILDVDGQCQWSGAWAFENGVWTEPQSNTDSDGVSSGLDPTMIGIVGALVFLIVLLTLFFIRKGGDGDDVKDFASVAGGFGGVVDQTEQYVQQLIAQGYPEDTARAYAQQYAAQAAGAAAPAAATAAAPAMDNAVYQQYYQQFVSQGYDEQTAATYAQQYAAQHAQQQQ
jgi:hypothetical protein